MPETPSDLNLGPMASNSSGAELKKEQIAPRFDPSHLRLPRITAKDAKNFPKKRVIPKTFLDSNPRPGVSNNKQNPAVGQRIRTFCGLQPWKLEMGRRV